MKKKTEAKKLENTSDNKPKRDARGRLLPGNTANPKGKPKGSISLKAILKEQLAKKPPGQKPGEEKTHAELLIARMLKSAIADGNDQQIKNIFQYIEGMPKQTIAIEDDEELTDEEIDRRIFEALNDKRSAKNNTSKV